MAKASGIGDRFYYHGTDISGDASALSSLACPSNTLPITAINSTTEERTWGQASGMVSGACWFNDALSQPILDQLPSTDIVLMYAKGSTIGNPCYSLTAQYASLNMNRGQDGSLSLDFDAQGNNTAGEWGILLTAGQVTVASSAATAPTGVVGSQTAYGGTGFLQYQERASGTPTFLIEDSSDTTDGDDGTWGTLLTFAGTGGTSPFGERKTVTGTVEKGVRAATPTGTYSNAVFVIGFRRGDATDRLSLA